MTQDLTISVINDNILTLPERPPFMLASQLAEFYEIQTGNLTRAYRRNIDMFPDDFVFELTELEVATLRAENTNSLCQNGIAIPENTRFLPVAFTRIGAYALSGCLKTPRAKEVSVMIYRAFGKMMDRSKEMARLQRNFDQLKAHMLSSNFLWSKIAHGQEARVSRLRMPLYLKRSQRESFMHISEMERLGVIDGWAWSDCFCDAEDVAEIPDA